MKFRKKPVVIDAFRMGQETPPDWFMDRVTTGDAVQCGMNSDRPYAEIKTLEGTMTASHGDWIIKGVAGEVYPCKPEIFNACYEPEGDQ